MPDVLQAAHLQKKNFECKQAPTHNEVQVEFNVIPGVRTYHANQGSAISPRLRLTRHQSNTGTFYFL